MTAFLAMSPACAGSQGTATEAHREATAPLLVG